MNRFIILSAILIICCFSAVRAPAQSALGLSSVTQTVQKAPDSEEFVDSAPGLGIFALFAIVVLLLLVGAGIALGAVVLCAMAVCAAVGILTTSTIAGLVAKKPGVGVKVFFLQLGAAVGVVAGTGLALLAAWIIGVQGSRWFFAFIGAVLGLFAGATLAALFNLLWEKLLALLLKKKSKTPA